MWRLFSNEALQNNSFFLFRSNPPDVFIGKCVLKTCSKFTGEHTHPWVFSYKLAAYFQNAFSKEQL